MARWVSAKFRSIGLSNFSPGRINFSRSNSAILRMAGMGFSSEKISFNSVKQRCPKKRLNRFIFTAFFRSFSVCLPMVNPIRCSKRIALKIRVGSSTKLKLCKILILRSFISVWQLKKSTRVPNFSGFKLMAMALMVKSRRYRSSFKEESSTVGMAAGYS